MSTPHTAPFFFDDPTLTIDQLDARLSALFDGIIAVMQLPKITLPKGDTPVWTYLSPGTENRVILPQLDGVLVGGYRPRGWWPTAYHNGANDPPICASFDGKTGYGNPNETGFPTYARACLTCEMNRMGSSSDGRGGKACKESWIVLMMLPGLEHPVRIQVSRTSLLAMQQYFRALKLGNIAPQSVITILRLSTAKGYATVLPSMGPMLSESASQLAAHYAAYLKPLVEREQEEWVASQVAQYGGDSARRGDLPAAASPLPSLGNALSARPGDPAPSLLHSVSPSDETTPALADDALAAW
jgi:hypothetical protein